MDNFLHKYFNNKSGEPLQTDVNGLYFGASEMEYKFKYRDSDGNWWDSKLETSEWDSLSSREFILSRKREGKPVRIYEVLKRKRKEEEE